MIRPATLDCHGCGITVRTLDAVEAARVDERCAGVITYCPACRTAPRGRPTEPVSLLACGHWQKTEGASTASAGAWCRAGCGTYIEVVAQWFPVASATQGGQS